MDGEEKVRMIPIATIKWNSGLFTFHRHFSSLYSNPNPPPFNKNGNWDKYLELLPRNWFSPKWKWKSLNLVRLFSTPWTIVHGNLQATILEWVAFPFSRASSQTRAQTGSPTLQVDSLPAEPQGSPRILEWVAYPFSSRPSRPRNRTGVSCIAGRFFTNWAMREAWPSLFHHTCYLCVYRPD